MGQSRCFTVLLLTSLFMVPAALCTSSPILLNKQEKKTVGKGQVVVREVATSNQPGRTFEAIGFINASKKQIEQVLTTYEKYPEFMPNVSRVDIIEQQGNKAVLNYTLTLPLGKIKRYRLEISLTEPDNKYSLIQWQLLDWPELKEEETIKDTKGFWRIEGRTHRSSLVQYHVYTDPGHIPFGLGWIVDVLSKNSVPEALRRTKSRAEEIAVKESRAP